MKTHIPRTAKNLATATVFLAIIVGCSEPARKYDIPKTLCGLKIPQDSYSSLFKPGDKIDKEGLGAWGTSSMSQGCRYDINGLPAVNVDGDWRMAGDDLFPSDPKSVLKKGFPSSSPRSFDGKFQSATWRQGVAVVANCHFRTEGDDYDRYLLRIHVNHLPFGDDERRADKKFGDLGQKTMTEVVKRLPCKGV